MPQTRYKYAETLSWTDEFHVLYRGRELLCFAGCDYLRLSAHPAVRSAINDTLARHGLTVAASRITTGNHQLYSRLEQELARFANAETAVLAPNGYTANLIATQAVAGKVTHVLVDERAHASLLDAARLLECPIATFKHRHVDDLKRQLNHLPASARPLVMTDGLFAGDGSIAPLKEQIAVLPPTGWLLLDDAHGFGVLGKHGRGTPEWSGAQSKQVIQTVSLSKAVGVFGGAILTSHAHAERILSGSRLFAGSTPMPLPLVGGALAALKVLNADSARRKRLVHNAARIKNAIRSAGIALPDTPAPIVSVQIDSAPSAVDRFRRHLLAHGIYPTSARYPGTAASNRFRFVISSEHSVEQIDQLAKALVTFPGLRP
ncbi:MAG: aminotransferase class I/II-fold pyridoxal phosphate-dependent enzyme [Verrucomicrobia bacterium]|nr:aminotransferase class I/II-fold pyridoxal phosphate-dependent enzyme [Verrucomicrobiota bacterium]